MKQLNPPSLWRHTLIDDCWNLELCAVQTSALSIDSCNSHVMNARNNQLSFLKLLSHCLRKIDRLTFTLLTPFVLAVSRFSISLSELRLIYQFALSSPLFHGYHPQGAIFFYGWIDFRMMSKLLTFTTISPRSHGGKPLDVSKTGCEQSHASFWKPLLKQMHIFANFCLTVSALPSFERYNFVVN